MKNAFIAIISLNILALITALGWLYFEPGFEPGITSLAFAIALIALYTKTRKQKEKQSVVVESGISEILLLQTIGGPGSGNGEFRFEGGTDANGGIFVDENYLYVTDWNNERLQYFKLDANNFWVYSDSLIEGLSLYSAVFVEQSGGIFLQENGGIRKYDADKNFVANLPVDTSNFRRFTLDPSGNIFAQSGHDNNVIIKYDPDGSFLLEFGGFGSADGKFNNTGWTGDIVSDSVGNIYMLDSGGGRLQKFDGSGNFIKKWPVQIGGYSLMAIDENERIYVTESGNTVLRRYTTEGVLQEEYSVPARTILGGGSYIFVREGKLFVSNRIEHTIKVFSLSKGANRDEALGKLNQNLGAMLERETKPRVSEETQKRLSNRKKVSPQQRRAVTGRKTVK
jgi:hypothetical protein